MGGVRCQLWEGGELSTESDLAGCAGPCDWPECISFRASSHVERIEGNEESLGVRCQEGRSVEKQRRLRIVRCREVC